MAGRTAVVNILHACTATHFGRDYHLGARVKAVHGVRGVGKKCAVKPVSNDKDVQAHCSSGAYF